MSNKISKLLNLALHASTGEGEASAALNRARSLMSGMTVEQALGVQEGPVKKEIVYVERKDVPRYFKENLYSLKMRFIDIEKNSFPLLLAMIINSFSSKYRSVFVNKIEMIEENDEHVSFYIWLFARDESDFTGINAMISMYYTSAKLYNKKTENKNEDLTIFQKILLWMAGYSLKTKNSSFTLNGL